MYFPPQSMSTLRLCVNHPEEVAAQYQGGLRAHNPVFCTLEAKLLTNLARQAINEPVSAEGGRSADHLKEAAHKEASITGQAAA